MAELEFYLDIYESRTHEDKIPRNEEVNNFEWEYVLNEKETGSNY